MSGGQRQQDVEAPATVAQQPVAANSRFPKCPYVRRGFRLSNGWRIPGAIFILFMLAGGIMIFLGILFAIIVFRGVLAGVTLALIGVTVFVPGILLCMKAKNQYEALVPEAEGDTTPPPTPA